MLISTIKRNPLTDYFLLFAEEEIDVVSVGDKNLPTNPSAKDRRALQTTVAHKITAARMIKTTTGVRTIPPCRRGSDTSTDDSIYGTTSGKCRQPTYNYSGEAIPSSATGTIRHLQSTKSNVVNPRKRGNTSTSAGASANKRAKGGKKGAVTATAAAINCNTRQNSIDESETIDKRNLHNDMERQRRIGLKNLFENLKDKIPSLREKDRAPKVNILREATILCNKFTREDAELEALKLQQKKLFMRLKSVRASIAAEVSKASPRINV